MPFTDGLDSLISNVDKISADIADLPRLRAIEEAAVSYRNAKLTMRLAMIRGDDSGPAGHAAAAAETTLFMTLNPIGSLTP